MALPPKVRAGGVVVTAADHQLDPTVSALARFVPPAITEKYSLVLPEYPGTAQIVELA